MKTLLHICCAPCSITCIEALRAKGHLLTGFWYNPNIHPYQEYKSRRDTLRNYAPAVDLPMLWEDSYGLRPFLTELGGRWEAPERCGHCYACRLEAAAQIAASESFEAFTTTLLVSPYQDRELLRELGQAAGERFGVTFLPEDFRPRFREGQNAAREQGLYRQKYCGCVFSEEERYKRAGT